MPVASGSTGVCLRGQRSWLPQNFSPERHHHQGAGKRGNHPFPPLVDDPDGILALPPGFSYEIVTYAGRTRLRDDQGLTPSNHDGTAAFDARRGRLRLIQNHELPAGSPLGVPHVTGTVYDPTALMGGGCTVIETNRSGANLGEFVGISGTLTNCAGGPTPWGTWLTCEETDTKAGTPWSGNGQTGSYSRDHGYVFEVFGDGRATSVRKQFTDEITRGKKFEGVFGTDQGVYVVNSFAFNTGDLPDDAVKHDGMVWFYSYADQTITLVTYFPHQNSTSDGTTPRYDGVVFDAPRTFSALCRAARPMRSRATSSTSVRRARRSSPSSPDRRSPPTARCCS